MPVYKITEEKDITDGYTRYFLYIDNKYIIGADSLDKIEEFADKIKANNGNKIISKILNEYSC